jgi:hypothetical protein
MAPDADRGGQFPKGDEGFFKNVQTFHEKFIVGLVDFLELGQAQ